MKKTCLWSVLFALLSVALVSSVSADVRMPRMFSNNCVLQRGVPVNVFGFADAGEKVTVEFNGQKIETTACEAGKWLVKLAPMETKCEGSVMTITGKNTITVENVVVGEVWVCSGQSNMEYALGGWGRVDATEEELTGDNSFIRFLRDAYVTNPKPQEDLAGGAWIECKDGQQKPCTAVGFYFAKRLHDELGCPIGLIHCNWGGSKVEEWMPAEGMAMLSEETAAHAREFVTHVKADNRKYTGCMFNGKLSPWTKYTIKGAIWYQGCSNGGQGQVYFEKMQAMIQSWRAIWGYEFPFYWVQLANYQAPNDDPNTMGGFVPVRAAQTKCLTIPKTGQAVTIDIGEANDIHPINKFTVGNRLAVCALANDYGKDVIYASPLFKSMKVEGNKAILTFDNGGTNLVVGKQNVRKFSIDNESALKCFAVAGADGKYYWAEAKITSANTIEVSAPEVATPVNVRYAYQQNPEGANLYNVAGLPASPFSTEPLK
ncbi:MAG: sialate O-acetylesterase [Planctomycetia bacterium]|nr:sialate O-acetylesterase [Planctomycetia bacterium]